MKTEIRIITPQMATTYLESRHDRQRKITKNRVTQYAGEMVAGRWSDSQDAIAFDKNGKLINGQHRMAAVVLADTPSEFLVVTGMHDACMKVMDSQQNRSQCQRMFMSGVEVNQKEWSIARVIVAQKYGMQIIRNQEVVADCFKYYKESIRTANYGPTKHYAAPPRAAMAILLEDDIVSAETASSFRDAMEMPQGPQDWAATAFRRLAERTQSGSIGVTKLYLGAQKAIVAFHEGKSLRTIIVPKHPVCKISWKSRFVEE